MLLEAGFFRDWLRAGRDSRRVSCSSSTAAPLPAYGWGLFFALLKRHGFSARCVVDVGANRGNWTREARGHFPSAEFVMIEPQDQLRAHVADLLQPGTNVRWVTAGASDRPGKLALTLAPRDDSSSFIPTAGQAAAAGYRQTEVEVRTINEIVASVGGPVPDMIKIDAEGFDLKALAGASDFFGKTDIFFVEAAVCATGIPNTVAAVVAAMDAIGYRMIDITDINRSPRHGVLWLCELAFMRQGCPLLGKISSYE
ncbi:MAG: FkbM family methyltransferase [Opitutaceae bacterium]